MNNLPQNTLTKVTEQSDVPSLFHIGITPLALEISKTFEGMK